MGSFESEKKNSVDLAKQSVGISFLIIKDLKIIILGYGRVGKTSFLCRYINDEFSNTLSTIGASFVLKRWKSCYFGIWDTAGQERFSKISSFYCRGAQAAILAYDITDRESFDQLPRYIDFLGDADPDCYMVFIGTKADLREQRQVSAEEGREMARRYRAPFFETSAKDNVNVSVVFDTIGHHCLAGRITDSPLPTTPRPPPPSVPTTTTAPSKPCCSIQ